MTPPGDLGDVPLVSVCVTTYNHAAHISECLDSILDQHTGFPYEICLGEDESSDGTREICQQYAARHPDRIRLFLRSRAEVIYVNKRPTGKFNFFKTFQACRGKYIAICEGDDFWVDPDKLQKQVRALEEHPDCALCFSNARVVYTDGTPGHEVYAESRQEAGGGRIGIIARPPAVSDIEELAAGNFIHTPTVLFRNWLLAEPFPEFMRTVMFGDWPLHMCTARFGRLLFLDEVMAAYRVHDQGRWSRMPAAARQMMTADVACEMLDSGCFPATVQERLQGTVHALVDAACSSMLGVVDLAAHRAWLESLVARCPGVGPRVEMYLQKNRWWLWYRWRKALAARGARRRGPSR